MPDLVEILLDLACFCKIWLDFLYNFDRVWVAWVLEMQTRHLTCQCRFLRMETCCRLTRPLVLAGIGWFGRVVRLRSSLDSSSSTITEIWKKTPKSAFYCQNLHFFRWNMHVFTKNCWNLAGSS